MILFKAIKDSDFIEREFEQYGKLKEADI